MRLSAQSRFFLNNISMVALFIPKKLGNHRKKENKLVCFAQNWNDGTMEGWNIGTKTLDSNTEVMRF